MYSPAVWLMVAERCFRLDSQRTAAVAFMHWKTMTCLELLTNYSPNRKKINKTETVVFKVEVGKHLQTSYCIGFWLKQWQVCFWCFTTEWNKWQPASSNNHSLPLKETLAVLWVCVSEATVFWSLTIFLHFFLFTIISADVLFPVHDNFSNKPVFDLHVVPMW